ncbi:MAG: 3'(2'),5'-bisphosphate nucleotidase CysQ [Rhodospirillales bacterium]
MTLAITDTTLDHLLDISRRAGEAIMAVYATDFDVERKGDASPVTEADKRADDVIRAAIRAELTDAYPLVTEETFEGDGPEVGSGRFWLVDPLDGTKEFIKRNGEFTVNIALIEDHRPIMGCVHAPAIGKSYIGAEGLGAYRFDAASERQAVRVRPLPDDGWTALVSRSHPSPETEAYLANLTVAGRISAGSSLKFCLVAEGSADVYPRFGPTMEWDTAAGDAVLRAAGGLVEDVVGNPFRYGKPGFRNPGFIAKARAS